MNTRTLASGSVAFVDDDGRVVRIVKPIDASHEDVTTQDHDVNVKCNNCQDGLYYISGSVVNGVFQGRTGTCFQCAGKGFQTPEDRKRNLNYDRYFRRVYF